MVGRPGRSRRCLTCRRRKIKCDETKPSCNRCEASGLVCEGYVGTTFITTTSDLQETVSSTFLTHNTSVVAAGSTTVPTAVTTSSLVLGSSFVASPKILRTPPTSPLDETLLFSYLHYILPVWPSHRAGGPEPWVGFYACSGHDGENDNARSCLLALAGAAFGRERGYKAAELKGWRLYSICLRSLNKRLQEAATSSPNLTSKSNESQLRGQSGADNASAPAQLDDDTLLSVMLLGTYELMMASSPSGWVRHYLGLGLMMRLRGPAAHVDHLPRRILEINRLTITLASLVTRQHTFLAEPDWCTVPWQSEPKDDLQTLLDHVVAIPALQCEADQLLVPVEASYEDRAQTLYQKAMDALDGLLDWRAMWDLNLVKAASEVPASTVTSDSTTVAVFPTLLSYPSLGTASMITRWGAFCIFLYEILGLVAPVVMMHDSTDFEQGDGPDVEKSGSGVGGSGASLYGIFEVDARATAIEICRTIPYLLSSAHRMAGPMVTVHPLRMAWKVLNEVSEGREGTPMSRWLMSQMAKLGDGKALGVSNDPIVQGPAPGERGYEEK